jgi:hypothetical protein
MVKKRTPYDSELMVATKRSPFLFAEFFLKGLLLVSTPKFHLEIYELLTKCRRLVLASPRGFAKSTLVSVIYPIWLALWGGAKDICIISASETLAVDWLRKIKRELTENALIREYFGDQVSDKWSENHIILKNGVNIRARGAGGQIRGFRPDVIICDDLETDDGVRSEDQRRLLKDWLFKACLNTLTPDGQFIIIGTVLHPLSLLSDLLVSDIGWDKKKYMAYHDGKQDAGHELWAELWPHDKIMQRKREIGSFRFASEFMNSPISDETAPIKDHQIRIWTELPKQYNAVIAVDPAYSEDDTADYKVASLILCDSNANRYLAHYIRMHGKIGEFQDAIINLWLSHRGEITAIGIPNSGVEKAFFESFLRKCGERKLYPPIMELKNSFVQSGTSISVRNKTARIIAALQPLFEQGKYYIGSEMIEARDELMSIGFSKNDDICLDGNTLVATPFGDRKIKDFVVGDKVITPQGIQKVIAAGCTGYKEVVINFGITGTPKHQVFTYKGFDSLDSLSYGISKISKLSIMEVVKWRYLRLLNSMEKNTVSWVERESIISKLNELMINEKVLKDFTLRFGNFITKQKYRQAFMFTIEMVILSITTLKTLSVYRASCIIRNLKELISKKTKNIWQRLGHLRLNGIDQKLVVNGIESIQEVLCLKTLLKNVFVVVKSLLQNLEQQKYVLERVVRNSEGIQAVGMNQENALYVGQNFKQINIQRYTPVQRSANTSTLNKFAISKIPVYNITVENEGVYYANGVLVSNCDTLAYAENLIQPFYGQTQTDSEGNNVFLEVSSAGDYGYSGRETYSEQATY